MSNLSLNCIFKDPEIPVSDVFKCLASLMRELRNHQAAQCVKELILNPQVSGSSPVVAQVAALQFLDSSAKKKEKYARRERQTGESIVRCVSQLTLKPSVGVSSPMLVDLTF